MKKRILSSIIILVMILGLLPTVTLADTPTSGTLGDNLTWTLEETTGTLTISGTGDMIDSVWSPFRDFSDKILNAVVEEGVTSIGENTFNYCTNLITADIADSVLIISDNAFLGCESLTSVTIGNGVITIGEDAFRSCKKLNDVKIGSNVKTIKRDAFSGCLALTSIEIPNSVTTIEDYAFELCESLVSVTIPDSVISVGTNTFNRCKNLSNVKIGNNVPAITESMFYGCTSLVNITLGNSVKTIDKNAFQSCTALTSISLPDSVTTIKDNAFLWCDALSSIVVPDSVISVGGSAFSGCVNLKKASLSKSTAVIEANLFDDTGLKAIYIPKEITLVKKAAFDRTDLAYVYYGGSEEDKQNLSVLENNEVLTTAKWIYNATELPEHIYANECDSDCEICNSEREAPHVYGDYVSDNNATTEADGTKTRECSDCGNKDTVADVGSKIPTPAELTEVFSAASSAYFSMFLYQGVFENVNILAHFVISNYNQDIAEYADPEIIGSFKVPADVFENIIKKHFVTTDDDIAAMRAANIYFENNGEPYYHFTIVEAASDESPLYYGYKDNGNNEYTLYSAWFSDIVEETEEVAGTDGIEYVKYYGYKYSVDFGYALDVTYTNGVLQYKDYTVIEEKEKLFEIAKTVGYVRYDGTVVLPHTHEYTNACDTSCNTCGATRTTTHAFGEYVYNNDASEKADGTKTRTCSVCGHKETVTATGTKWTSSFTDIKTKDFYYKPTLWAVANEITTGTSKTTFSPDEACTRGQIVTFLWRAAGCPEPTTTTMPFTDVGNKAFYRKAVLWAVENGITSGTSKTTFSPNDPCTRGQIATFLWRAKGKPAPKSTYMPFNDVAKKDFYYKAVLWAVENKITSGTSKTTFAPSDSCTRGQIVTFLYRAYN